jgi:PPOX class probable F420-dependent enzyme
VGDTVPSRRLARLGERITHPDASFFGRTPALTNSVGVLGNARCVLLETEGVDGSTVPTAMCFVTVNDTIFVRIEPDSALLVRIAACPIVKVGACTLRGKPIDGYLECMARIVPPEREAELDSDFRRGYGLTCRILKRLTGGGGYVYFALTPLTLETPVPEDEALAAGVKAVREIRREPPPGAA